VGSGLLCAIIYHRAGAIAHDAQPAIWGQQSSASKMNSPDYYVLTIM